MAAGHRRPPNRTSFKPGPDPRRPKGRVKGVPNKVTRDVKEFLSSMVNDPAVQKAFRAQILAGDKGAMAAFLGATHLIVGKPRETHDVNISPSLSEIMVMGLQLKAETERAEREAAKAKHEKHEKK